MQQKNSSQPIDIEALKAQVDEEIASRLVAEAEYAKYIHRRGINVGELKLLVGMDSVSEVVEMPPTFRLPGAPAGVIGLANRHGRVVPVLDLLTLFDSANRRNKYAWLMVYGRNEDAVGVIVDSLPDRRRFAQGDEVSTAEITHPISTYAKAVYRGVNQDIWIDLDMEALFASIFQVDMSTA